jgi:hypothetical protein
MSPVPVVYREMALVIIMLFRIPHEFFKKLFISGIFYVIFSVDCGKENHH